MIIDIIDSIDIIDIIDMIDIIDDWWLLYIDMSTSPQTSTWNAFFHRHPEAAAALGHGLAGPRACGEGWTSLPRCRVSYRKWP